jgi:hypothetical protein
MSQVSQGDGGERAAGGHVERPRAASDLLKFTALAALLAISADAAIAHAMLWGNDPYWTCWVTDTLLMATVFGLGTAWPGMGLLRGLLITVVHMLLLTTYYWTLSPIGLRASPNGWTWSAPGSPACRCTRRCITWATCSRSGCGGDLLPRRPRRSARGGPCRRGIGRPCRDNRHRDSGRDGPRADAGHPGVPAGELVRHAYRGGGGRLRAATVRRRYPAASRSASRCWRMATTSVR